MGNEREYLKTGGFSAYLYENHPDWTPMSVNGVYGKVVKLKADPTGCHSGLPTFSDSSDAYFKLNKAGEVVQAKIYKDRRQSLDFDWGHSHTNTSGDGKTFPKGVVHVQAYTSGNNRQSQVARYMTEAEIVRYGPILRAFNPNVRFRP